MEVCLLRVWRRVCVCVEAYLCVFACTGVGVSAAVCNPGWLIGRHARLRCRRPARAVGVALAGVQQVSCGSAATPIA